MLMEPVNAPARCWPCACLKYVSGLRTLEKTLNFLTCIHVFHLVLKYGSDINEGNWLQLLFDFIVLVGIRLGFQMLFRHKWKQLITVSFWVYCLGEYICVVHWNEFFTSVSSFSILYLVVQSQKQNNSHILITLCYIKVVFIYLSFVLTANWTKTMKKKHLTMSNENNSGNSTNHFKISK